MALDYMIRLAVKADLPALPEIEDLAATRFEQVGLTILSEMDGMSMEDLRAHHQAGRLWVAVVEEKPVGFVAASVIGGHAHIDEIDVVPDYGGRGIGKALIEMVVTWAKEQGFMMLTLSTQINVAWNAPYYARQGFEIMPPEEWTADYRALRDNELAHGLPVADRVIMKRRL